MSLRVSHVSKMLFWIDSKLDIKIYIKYRVGSLAIAIVYKKLTGRSTCGQVLWEFGPTHLLETPAQTPLHEKRHTSSNLDRTSLDSVRATHTLGIPSLLVRPGNKTEQPS